MHKAMFWKKEGKSVRCHLCYRGCLIADGAWGFCGIRQNQGGTLFARTYGRACSYEIDPIEKKPFFHFWPGSTSLSFATVGCNFRCLHCQNYTISQAKPGEVSELDLPPEKIVEMAKKQQCKSISYTYTEPIVFFEYAYDTGVLARKEKLLNTFVTNGYGTPEALKKARDFLDAARIDLKGDKEHYLKVCGGVLIDKVLENIKNTYKLGYHTEIITLVIPGMNDQKEWVEEMAGFLKGLSPDIPWHFTRFYPCYKMLDRPATDAKTLEDMHDWALAAGMRYVYAGNIPGHKYENTYCHKCGELLIQRWSFEITKANLAKGNKCPACGAKIPIVGEVSV
jgi:pyruvate formate lyase activating enzyme